MDILEATPEQLEARLGYLRTREELSAEPDWVGWDDLCARIAGEADHETKLAFDHEISATMRRLEVMVGKALGPAPDPRETGARKGSGATEPLSADERRDFRDMAHEKDVEAVIAESTDERSLRRLLWPLPALYRSTHYLCSLTIWPDVQVGRWLLELYRERGDGDLVGARRTIARAIAVARHEAAA